MNKRTLYNKIMSGISKSIKTSITEDFHPNDIKLLNIDWEKISKVHCWFDNIRMENPIKYKASELKSSYISYDIVRSIQNMVDYLERLIIFFDDEKEWWVEIAHQTSYGSNSYSLSAVGNGAPYKISFSELNIKDKRSIKTKLTDGRQYFLYETHSIGCYVLRNTRTWTNPETHEIIKGKPVNLNIS